MKKVMLLLLMVPFLVGCKPGSTPPIARVSNHPVRREAKYFAEGIVHFTDDKGYVLDDFGYVHDFLASDSYTLPMEYLEKKNGENVSLSASDFKDGEKIVFGLSSSFVNGDVYSLWKYDESLVSHFEKIRGTVKENTTYVLVGEDGTQYKSLYSPMVVTSDFVETELDYTKNYLAYAFSFASDHSDSETDYCIAFLVED